MYSDPETLVELLQEAGYLGAPEVEEARSQLGQSETIIEGLLKQNKVSEQDIAKTCAVNASMDYLDLDGLMPDQELEQYLSKDAAKRYLAVPLGFDAGALKVAVADPLNFETIDSLPHVSSVPVDLVCADYSAVKRFIAETYGELEEAQASIGGLGGEGSADDADAPVIKLVTQILLDAFKAKGSDIHIEPLEESLRIRYRLDGALHEVANHPRKLVPAVISRIKIMTGTMSIAEKRLPQDGRIQMKLGDRDVDLRVSTVPTNHGESIVMRILDKTALLLGLPELGFFSDDQDTFEKLIALPDGILLVTGPTGSGKTTTLYACLNYMNKPDRKIITVEDPVEYEMPGINQVMVKESVGMTFAAALRAILRQAPNIIMIGEIRDLETAQIAINAALTGHLVFSTLHTNDAPSAVARLDDIGVKPFLISSAVRAVLAQRLVRKNCKDCTEDSQLTEQEIRTLQLDPSQLADAQIRIGRGCARCRQTGCRGRLGLFEIFELDDEINHLINEGASTPNLRRRARELGMRTLREDGVRKVLAGATRASEVLRVTMDT
ncbi:MAG: ATPase, T2SS/T4P/T4SS family [Verrucomicrobiota bacterium]